MKLTNSFGISKIRARIKCVEETGIKNGKFSIKPLLLESNKLRRSCSKRYESLITEESRTYVVDMSMNQSEIEIFLLDHAPIEHFWIFNREDRDIRLGLIGFLGIDGLGYTIMDDDERRALACIDFLKERGCPVFDDIDEMDRYAANLYAQG